MLVHHIYISLTPLMIKWNWCDAWEKYLFKKYIICDTFEESFLKNVINAEQEAPGPQHPPKQCQFLAIIKLEWTISWCLHAFSFTYIGKKNSNILITKNHFVITITPCRCYKVPVYLSFKVISLRGCLVPRVILKLSQCFYRSFFKRSWVCMYLSPFY